MPELAARDPSRDRAFGKFDARKSATRAAWGFAFWSTVAFAIAVYVFVLVIAAKGVLWR